MKNNNKKKKACQNLISISPSTSRVFPAELCVTSFLRCLSMTLICRSTCCRSSSWLIPSVDFKLLPLIEGAGLWLPEVWASFWGISSVSCNFRPAVFVKRGGIEVYAVSVWLLACKSLEKGSLFLIFIGLQQHLDFRIVSRKPFLNLKDMTL